ncbi:MAG: chemotaxis protein CheD, partial [bacterium]
KLRHNKAKFANSAIEEMLDKMIQLGASKQKMEAKRIGGAHLFAGVKVNDAPAFNVGERNIVSAKDELAKQNIKLVAEDVGGDYGRSVEFDLETGKIKIRTIAWGLKEI